MKNRFCDASLLKQELDGYVLGQDEGVKRIAMAVSSICCVSMPFPKTFQPASARTMRC